MFKILSSLFLSLFLITYVYPQSLKSDLLSNESYITGEDGVIRMHVNIIGHVKYPGTYIVYDGIDILTTISMAGGYLPGSKLKDITIYQKDGYKYTVNLNRMLTDNLTGEHLLKLLPSDTIYIEQKTISKLLSSSNLPSILLSILNVIITLERD